MAGQGRSINKIYVPIVSDVGGFGKGLGKAKKDAEKFYNDLSKRSSLFSTSIGDGMSKARIQLEALGKTNLGVVTKGMAGLAAAGIAAAGAIGTLGFKHISELGKDAVSLGTSAEALSRLRGVARATGTDVDSLGEFIKGLTLDINESIGKTTTAGEAMKALGTSAEELSRMTPDEQIKKLNEGFAALPNDAERAKVAMKLAGQNGVKMFRMLALGSADFKKAFDSAPIVTDDDVSEIRKLQIALDKIGATIQSIADLFTTVLAPKIESVADMLGGFAAKFGVTVKAIAKPQAKGGETAKVGGAMTDPGKAEAIRNAQAEKQAQAERAREAVDRLQKLHDKEASNLRSRPRFVPSTNGNARRNADQSKIDQHAQTSQALNAAKARAATLADEAKSVAGAMSDAMRLNQQLMQDVATLKQDYRQTIEGAGKDEIHRRVDQLKGIDPNTRKQLIRQGYQAREAGKSSALRDELQESTKLPVEKLGEDLARISKMAALGEANGGLSKAQALRAAAMKTQEAGIAGGQTQFAGALQSNSIEGRSYLLSQTIGKPESMLETARKGLEATMQGNGYLARIARDLGRSLDGDVAASY